MMLFGGKDFKIAALPGKDFAKGGLATKFTGDGVNNIAVLDPDAAFGDALSDTERGGAAGKAFELNEIDEVLALHAAETAGVLVVAVEEGLDAILEELHFLAVAGFLPEQLDALGVGAGAE